MKKRYLLFLTFIAFGTSNAQIINFPDAYFKTRLLQSSEFNWVAEDENGETLAIDANDDGEIDVNEAAAIYTIEIPNTNFTNNIYDLTGIEHFTNLRKLNVIMHQMTSIDVSALTHLEWFATNGNPLTSINITGLSNLKTLICNNGNLSNLDVTDSPLLEYLSCGNNPNLASLNVSGLLHLKDLSTQDCSIVSLDVSGNPSLNRFVCYNNQLTMLNVSGCTGLTDLYCDENALTNLSLSDCIVLEKLDCSDNQLTTIDLSQLVNLDKFQANGNLFTNLDLSKQIKLNKAYIHYNPLLTTLNLKNGKVEDEIYIDGNAALQYICSDEQQFDQMQAIILQNGFANCALNSYCTFTPGGSFSTFSGNVRLDLDNNGCTNEDAPFPNLQFNITNGTTSGTFIANDLEGYSIPLQSGTHTITPVLENSYFTITPNQLTVPISDQASEIVEHFCVTLNGIHSDLEIAIFPILPARPGFDATYKLLYKNKGNQTQSGSVYLAFDDNRIDFIAATPAMTTQNNGALTWNFSNLQPFESREILVTLNVNSPMETPAVNAGDMLNFTAYVNGGSLDETSADNTIDFHQTVVGSFDPNDKTCIEGSTITPNMVGNYIHYVIRFENTGTYAAGNIVVKDMIDTTKFDIASLIPLDGSHPFVTRITNTNKVEFIFEDINLPFDDANNDGYVMFKIKTSPTLALGNSFSNTASIYFDYNHPIVTDPAVTSVALLSTSDFSFDNHFTLYPNPTSNLLNIKANDNTTITSLSVYNTLGQVVITIPNRAEVIDVSSLPIGNYFIKLQTDKGSSVARFIKQ